MNSLTHRLVAEGDQALQAEQKTFDAVSNYLSSAFFRKTTSRGCIDIGLDGFTVAEALTEIRKQSLSAFETLDEGFALTAKEVSALENAFPELYTNRGHDHRLRSYAVNTRPSHRQADPEGTLYTFGNPEINHFSVQSANRTDQQGNVIDFKDPEMLLRLSFTNFSGDHATMPSLVVSSYGHFEVSRDRYPSNVSVPESNVSLVSQEAEVIFGLYADILSFTAESLAEAQLTVPANFE